MSTIKKSSAPSPKTSEGGKPMPSDMPFTMENYRWLLIGVALLVVGYVGLLIPGDFVDSKSFSVALYVAPWFILGGFLSLIYAILKK